MASAMVLLMFYPAPCVAKAPESAGGTRNEVMADSVALPEVMVTARRPKEEIIPAQRLSGRELERLNSHSVADALRYFSGVQVKDYGGVGGIKTVNIRSMGTNHTGVVYD